MPAKTPRSYESPLRAEQVEQVRRRILEAATELVANDGHAELSLRRVAMRAQVSVPTVYRYFPSVAALSEALFEHINDRLGFPRMPGDMAGAVALGPILYAGFERDDRLVRAYLQSPVRKRHQRTRYALIRKAVDRSCPDLAPAARQRVAAVVQTFLSGQTWVNWHDHWGLDGKDAGELSSWVLGLVADAVRRAPQSVPGAVPRSATRKEKP